MSTYQIPSQIEMSSYIFSDIVTSILVKVNFESFTEEKKTLIIYLVLILTTFRTQLKINLYHPLVIIL